MKFIVNIETETETDIEILDNKEKLDNYIDNISNDFLSSKEKKELLDKLYISNNKITISIRYSI